MGQRWIAFMECGTQLRKIVFGEKRERCFVEGTILGGIVFPLIKMNHFDVYIYGGGSDISSVILYFINCGIEVKGILDIDKEKAGKMVLGKVPIIDPYSLDKKLNPVKTIAIINTIFFTGMEQFEIVNLLLKIGIEKFYSINDREKIHIMAQTSQVDSGRIDYYREHYNELEETYHMLYDAESRAIMLEYVRVYMQFGVYSLPQCDSRVKYFWGNKNKQRKCYEEIYEHLENEVWINCGSSIGDTIFLYFSEGFNAKKIYAYEGNKNTYDRLCFHLKYLPEQFKCKVRTINEYISEETDFEKILGDEKVTLVNADIEGGEYKLLKSMSKMIYRDRPVLAICAYHKASDLIELPQYINSIVDNYCFILRKYEAALQHVCRNGELVLFAVPKERNCEDS